MNVTWRIHMCDETHSYVWHHAFIRVTWRIQMCDVTDSYVWHDAFIRVTWLFHTCDMTHSYMRHDSFIRDSFICVTWLIHTCDMAHSYVWHNAFIRVTLPMHTCDVTHSCAWHGSFIRVPWLIHTCDMTNSYVCHDSFIRVTWPIYTCDVALLYVRQNSPNSSRGSTRKCRACRSKRRKWSSTTEKRRNVVQNTSERFSARSIDFLPCAWWIDRRKTQRQGQCQPPVAREWCESVVFFLSHMNESFHMSVSTWVHDGLVIEKPSAWTSVSLLSHTSDMNQPCHEWMSHVTCKWVVAHVNESRNIRISHVIKKIKSHVCVSDVHFSVQKCVIKGRDNCVSNIFLISLSFASLNLNYLTFPFS